MSLLKKMLVGLVIATALGAAAFYLPQLVTPRELTVSGVVEIQEVRLGSKLGGRVAEVLVQEGEIAPPGKLLVRFETPELEAQQQQQVSRIAAAEANLEKTRHIYRPEEIRQAKGDLDSLVADLRFAEADFKRVTVLFEDKKLTRSEFDSAQARLRRMEGQVASAQAHYDLLCAGSRAEDIALMEAALAEAQGKLKEIEANLAEANVSAPERCLIEVVSIRKGDLVVPNQPVLRVLRADDLWVKAYVPETRLGEVRVGQEVTLTIDSYRHRQFQGTVFHISSESEFTPRNIQSVEERRYQVFGLKIRVDDTEGIFKSGMSAKVVFPSPPPTESSSRVTDRH